jgi:hypothetical protein
VKLDTLAQQQALVENANQQVAQLQFLLGEAEVKARKLQES